jgi:hypothetical protein
MASIPNHTDIVDPTPMRNRKPAPAATPSDRVKKLLDVALGEIADTEKSARVAEQFPNQIAAD